MFSKKAVVVSKFIVRPLICAALITSFYTINESPAAAQANVFAPPGPSSPPPAPAPVGQQIGQLNWSRGPAMMQVSGVATLHIPFGYAVLAPPDSETFLRLNGNPVNDNGPANYIIAPEDQNARWFAAMYYEDRGHIADDQKIDADALFQTIKSDEQQENTLRQQQNMPTMDLVGWGAMPSYDKQTHRLEWAFQFSDSSGEKTENFNTRLLSRTGDMHIILVDNPDSIPSDISEFNTSIAGLDFNDGQRYADYRSGDRLAAYGIAGLIAGGAAAAAAKTGLLAGLVGVIAASGKAIMAAILAAFAFGRRYIKRIFKRQ